jgi:hypothetical protein
MRGTPDSPPAAHLFHPPDDVSTAFLLGILAGEGHFGGDGRQPHVTLRMHVRHERIFRWLASIFPGSRVYGPYHHGGRHYLQWMIRGRPLREQLLPLLLPLFAQPFPGLDDHVRSRFTAMFHTYGIPLPPSWQSPCVCPSCQPSTAVG